ncbi:hydrogenase expression/formation protein HupK [Cognatiyoonia sp. IB215182]|uniref:hydrogenase expression/formation protein HupK n=1 Tax=Cognatiyoonia sp. IB215182 TaxID=3097353 RepID=UPI002A16E73D|nr:hydrogenase expression/formation protein HupK [Cognatiyoonia sp. IB215182]MDX8355474.1 hydrogenase expression/formation protein HupK [Cognatiyoonia sp. IB215182]
MLDLSASSTLSFQPAPALPVSRLVVGREVGEVVELLPRLFNLCRAAQGAAVEVALGRKADTDGIAIEILRDHLLKFHVTWPACFGRPPTPLPDNWAVCGPALSLAAFGPPGEAPATAADFFDYLTSDTGYAPVLRLIDGSFATGEAVADLPPVTAQSIWSPGSVDNSVASRVARHPAMLGIAESRGKGPLWRAAARLYDLHAINDGDLPSVATPTKGEAIVPAARGSYAVRIEATGDTVTRFDRVTPTDHLLAAGGVLDCALSTLPATKGGLGNLLLDVLDPCSPVRLTEVGHA